MRMSMKSIPSVVITQVTGTLVNISTLTAVADPKPPCAEVIVSP
jgi:hypothetical protein